MPRPAPCDHPTPELVGGAGAIAARRAGSRVTPLAHGASVSRLDGDRLYLQHGPINLIVRAGGSTVAVEDAYEALTGVFPTWLGALVEELPRLRSPESPRLARRRPGRLRNAWSPRYGPVRTDSSPRWRRWPARWPTRQRRCSRRGRASRMRMSTTAATSPCIWRPGRACRSAWCRRCASDPPRAHRDRVRLHGARRRDQRMAGPFALVGNRGCRHRARAQCRTGRCGRDTRRQRGRRGSPRHPPRSRLARSTRTATSETCWSRRRCPHWTRIRSTPRSTPACWLPTRCDPGRHRRSGADRAGTLAHVLGGARTGPDRDHTCAIGGHPAGHPAGLHEHGGQLRPEQAGRPRSQEGRHRHSGCP